MSVEDFKVLISQRINEQLNESASLTNGEALKIGKLAKKEAEKIRKRGDKLAEDDATYMELFASDAFSRNLKRITRTMNGGETENREDVFAVVSSVIGKDRARDLAAGKY